ncbi:MAG: hypothetical protein NZO58_05410 [Gemmataceae bacterium]|nr:hypothetical protein [Gemmataceae bacterium]
MRRDGAEYLITGFQRGPTGTKHVQYRVGWVYGASGRSDEMYFCWQGPRLFVHAIGWLYPRDCWGHSAEAIEARPALSRCVECHNTWIAHVPGTLNEYRPEGMLLGVTCERCHGPGKEHVAFHRANPNAPAHAIVHPGLLERERLIEVCTQCHSLSVARRVPAFSYRPGTPLAEAFRTGRNRFPEEDLVGNQIQYLRESKCFQKSEMTCITCHDPHHAAQHEAAGQSCLQCHQRQACKDQDRLPPAVRDDCAACHMPPRVWMGACFHTSDDHYYPVTARSDHRIAVYPEAKKTVLLHWLRKQTDSDSRRQAEQLAKELGDYWIGIAEQCRQQYRLLGDMRAMREAVKVDSRPSTRKRLEEAIARQLAFDRLNEETNSDADRDPTVTMARLRRLLQMKPDDAKTHGKLGALLVSLGRTTEAVPHLQAVAQFDPNDAFGLSLLASLAYRDGRYREAAELYSQADEIEPYDAKTHYLWGLAQLHIDQVNDALRHFELAVQIDPRHAPAHQACAEALLRLGHADKAIVHAKRAVRLTKGKNIEHQLTLVDAYLAAQRPAEARAVLEAALAEAIVSNPAAVASLRARLRELP